MRDPTGTVTKGTGATGSATERPRGSTHKRIVVCCDGTWENSLGEDGGPLTNVTRLSRSLKQVCSDGTSQVIYYHPGIGTGGLMDSFLGGAFGVGLDSDIREGYNFICANYVEGDDIVLVGFSRGAFTARSIADLIASMGLLTTQGLNFFYPIFQDYENMANGHRSRDKFLDDSYDHLTEYNGEKGKQRILWENRRKEEYKQWLKDRHWTRDTFKDGTTSIRIKAVAVFDTVGSLGVPATPVLGITNFSSTWKFTSTQISSKVENAFQALALDEPRASFRPALWERLEENKTTHLKQVWFPGSHANVGGGWCDQQIACIALAWICDQLTTLGVEFSHRRLSRLFVDGLRYNAAHPYPVIPSPTFFIPSWIWNVLLRRRVPDPWAADPRPCRPPSPTERRDTADCTGKDHHPDGPPQQLWGLGGRPWALGQTRYPDSWFTVAAGTGARRPGCFMRVDPDTNRDTDEPLLNTNERVHASARVRLVLDGMATDDRRPWTCDPLLRDDSGRPGRPVWRLEKGGAVDPQERARDEAVWAAELGARRSGRYDTGAAYEVRSGDGQWRWVFEEDALVKNGVGQPVRPLVKVLPEEPMVGYWERHLLALTQGDDDVWRLAEDGGQLEPLGAALGTGKFA